MLECCQCGQKLPDNNWFYSKMDTDNIFCSEYCAKKFEQYCIENGMPLPEEDEG
jgi:hypothetical protein